jgi:hypothetical protein
MGGVEDDGLDLATIVGLLAEPVRLRVVAALVLGAETLGEVAAAAELAVPAVHRSLDRLVTGGLVEVTPGDRHRPSCYRVREEQLMWAARLAKTPTRVDLLPGAVPDEQREVLRNFLIDGHLTAIPAVRSKRLVVLDYLASRFEPGRVYPEREVNFVLGTVHPDYAALRRYLVDEGFLERREGFYWRVGGTFHVD